MIKVTDVHKSYGAQKVLDGIRFTIDSGAITSIIGRSGGGKTVLLKHLIGLERPDSGHIEIDGERLDLLRETDLNNIRKRIGVLFQDGALFDSLTVNENVAFPLKEHTKLKDEEIKRIVEKKLSTVGMSSHGDKYPAQISGGMRKRAGLARALALEPKVVFFDEPTSGLDPVTKAVIYDLIIKTHAENQITYVVVSHDIAGVFAVSDQIMMLWEGKILAKGTPKQMKEASNPIIRQFISGSAAGPIHMD